MDWMIGAAVFDVSKTIMIAVIKPALARFLLAIAPNKERRNNTIPK
jgi:hypothetical protein